MSDVLFVKPVPMVNTSVSSQAKPLFVLEQSKDLKHQVKSARQANVTFEESRRLI
jgi:hypothetical protein